MNDQTRSSPNNENRIKGMIESAGGKYAIMIDPENSHFGWTFKRHPDGQWVPGRKATEGEMYAARQHAKSTGQGVAQAWT